MLSQVERLATWSLVFWIFRAINRYLLRLPGESVVCLIPRKGLKLLLAPRVSMRILLMSTVWHPMEVTTLCVYLNWAERSALTARFRTIGPNLKSKKKTCRAELPFRQTTIIGTLTSRRSPNWLISNWQPKASRQAPQVWILYFTYATLSPGWQLQHSPFSTMISYHRGTLSNQ